MVRIAHSLGAISLVAVVMVLVTLMSPLGPS